MEETNTVPKRNLKRIALWVGGILLIPLVLTALNTNASIYGGPGGGWDWMPGDFVVMGALLFLTGLAIDFAQRKILNPAYRLSATIGIVGILVLIWIQLAVQGVSQLISLLLN